MKKLKRQKKQLVNKQISEQTRINNIKLLQSHRKGGFGDYADVLI